MYLYILVVLSAFTKLKLCRTFIPRYFLTTYIIFPIHHACIKLLQHVKYSNKAIKCSHGFTLVQLKPVAKEFFLKEETLLDKDGKEVTLVTSMDIKACITDKAYCPYTTVLYVLPYRGLLDRIIDVMLLTCSECYHLMPTGSIVSIITSVLLEYMTLCVCV